MLLEPADFFKNVNKIKTLPGSKLSSDFLPQTTYQVQDPSYVSVVCLSPQFPLLLCLPHSLHFSRAGLGTVLWTCHACSQLRELSPFCSRHLEYSASHLPVAFSPHTVSSVQISLPLNSWPSLSSSSFFPKTYHQLNLHSVFTIFPTPVSSMRVSSLSLLCRTVPGK